MNYISSSRFSYTSLKFNIKCKEIVSDINIIEFSKKLY